jgi:MFS family permease
VLAFSQLVGIARLWGYGLVDVSGVYGYHYLCGLELLKGFNSGLISSSAIQIASSLAPPGCESTAQGLYSGMYSGLSMAFGGIVGGLVLHYRYVAGDSDAIQIDNVQFMFRWVSVASLIITLALMAKFIFVDRVMGIPGFPRRHSIQK